MIALKDKNRNIIIFIKVKKTLIWKSVFLKLLTNFIIPLVTFFKLSHIKITKEIIAQKLMIQVVTKAFGLNKINF